MPRPLLFEWSYYLAWEIQQWSRAIMQAIPFARQMDGDATQVIEDPEKISAFFDQIGNRDNG